MNSKTRWAVTFAATVLTALAAAYQPTAASTLCVNSKARGCYPSITAAVNAATPGDTINVAPGTYVEGDIKIGKSLSLIGANSANTVINATGKGNGVYVDGLDNPGLSEVVVTGFTIENAKFEGILVTNASAVTISENRVVNNDLALNPSTSSCPGLPAFETNEGLDCGEGIHLSGVDHSTVADNAVQNNSGGILLSDDTGRTHHNLISGNIVQNNAFDCGITLASHALYSKAPTTLRGVDNNTISANDSSRNGLGAPSSGAGVGLFISGPGLETSGNVVIGNRVTDNSLPGIAMHQHTPNKAQNLNDNSIIGNYIAGNAGDDSLGTGTPLPTGMSLLGTAPVTGTVVMLNTFERESTDIAVQNAGGTVDVHLNNLAGDGNGVANLNGAGAVNATENWWKCAKGPGSAGCTSATGPNIVSTPFLTKPVVAE